MSTGQRKKHRKVHENKFNAGNRKNGKHYWLTPPDLYEKLNGEFAFDFDPCPFPVPAGFDGLTMPWGQSSYVNPPFGSIMHDGRRKGPTFWARKALEEYRQGKRVVFLYPVDGWLLLMLQAATEVRNLGDVRWLATEDGSASKGLGRPIAAFVLDPRRGARPETSTGVVSPAAAPWTPQP